MKRALAITTAIIATTVIVGPTLIGDAGTPNPPSPVGETVVWMSATTYEPSR